MRFSDIELPSNKKFGLFFALVFSVVCGYFFSKDSQEMAWVFGSAAISFAVVAFTYSEMLTPLNKLWMKFGLLLGMIVSPVVLAILYFLVFSPMGILMRLYGRDELRLKKKCVDSHWKNVEKNDPLTKSFKNQF